jgi:hypothetical protein
VSKSDEPNNGLKRIFDQYAKALHDAPGARKLAMLADTAKRIPAPLLDDLEALVAKLDDVPLVGNDIGVHLFDVAFCDAKYAHGTAFAIALRDRLQLYIDDPDVAQNERGVLRERVAWWRMAALGRAGELTRWPALVLKNMDHSNG